MREIKEIIIHCSATPEGKDFRAKDVDRWHKAKGWDGIGYHYIVCLDGTIEAGRPEEKIGAHAQGHNQRSIGICYIGGVDKEGVAKDTRTIAQKEAMRTIISALKAKYPDVDVFGHNEIAHKDCPCFPARKEYEDV